MVLQVRTKFVPQELQAPRPVATTTPSRVSSLEAPLGAGHTGGGAHGRHPGALRGSRCPPSHGHGLSAAARSRPDADAGCPELREHHPPRASDGDGSAGSVWARAAQKPPRSRSRSRSLSGSALRRVFRPGTRWPRKGACEDHQPERVCATPSKPRDDEPASDSLMLLHEAAPERTRRPAGASQEKELGFPKRVMLDAPSPPHELAREPQGGGLGLGAARRAPGVRVRWVAGGLPLGQYPEPGRSKSTP